MSITDLLREDLRDFAGYRSARTESVAGDVWLNANESPWPNAGESAGVLRRYPDPQPDALRARLAELYGCAPAQLLAGRGSDEAIDLLVRALCMPGQGAVVVTPPTFGMYAVSARLHGVQVVEAPLRDTPGGLECDFHAVAGAALESDARLVFLCSPGNPGGTALPLERVAALAERLRGRALVVVDEAYQEYADSPSAVALLAAHANIAVLRTLSKAHALAGARIGSVIADPGLIAALRRCQAPYPLAAPCVHAALQALGAAEITATRANVAVVVAERARLAARLAGLPGVRRVYPSSANFLLVRFDDAQSAFERLLAAGIVVRDMRAAPGLGDALRITIGLPEQNDRVVEAIAEAAVTA
ncbi:histidinol-phosphate transaminase [Lysobacter sp. N42]|uniref:histidinol-phosphate transaminase n=1 Tax=Lysobacter sp. N42 TaxID=2545719 RepID=UPI00104FBD2E|nr:histidinol-phosphate transaminase [Lysobacter sp. N42]TCZ88106.1 histidinol-phosphate transaminase [Lysobacter sp. N42]